MTQINRRKLLHQLTSNLLEQRGFPRKQDDYDIEWDAKEPDSQYSMCYEDVEIVIDHLDKLGYEIVSKQVTSTPPVTYSSNSPSAFVSTTGNVRIK